MTRILSLLFLVILLFPASLEGQESFAERKKRAKEFFYNARYQEAFNTLQFAARYNQEDKETKFLMAVCLYLLNRLTESENMLQEQISQKSPFSESWLYLAKIYHDQNDYLKASEYYKAYLKTLSSDDANRQLVRDAIRRCSNGMQWQFRPPLAIVENLGPGINTVYDEFGPIISPNTTDRLYFSSARPGSVGGLRNRDGVPDEIFGRYTTDIFSARLSNGQWKEVSGLSSLVNSPKHEVVFDFKQNGRSMYYFKGNTLSLGQIFVDTFSTGPKTFNSEPFFSPVDGIAGIGSPHFVHDTLVIFPSARPGGYGGLDLYQSIYSKGRWSAPENLGPEINSPYDETTPFLARDGKTLYFSSNNPQWSIGAFDVLKSVYHASAGRWTTPYNLGAPINSSGDETHFRLIKDGYTAFFASSRKDGYGERDLYAAYFFEYLPEMNPPTAAAPAVQQPSFDLNIAARGTTAATTGTTLTIQPVFFNSEQEPLALNNQKEMEALAAYLIQNPSTEVLLIGYSQVEPSVSGRLGGGLAAAKQLADILIKMGAPLSCLRIRGAIHPDMQTALKGVDCRILFASDNSLQIKYTNPIESNTTLAQAASQLSYRLLLAKTKQPFSSSLMAQLEAPLVEMHAIPSGDYLYFAGQFNTFAEALAARSRYGGAQASSIDIQPFVNDRILKPQALQTQVSRYSDLANYLQFIKK